eukprot:PRCOL_00005669-RA
MAAPAPPGARERGVYFPATGVKVVDREPTTAVDYYAVLGLDRAATAREVQRAYKRLALLWHPDKHARKAPHEQLLAKRRFEEARAAARVLGHAATRAAYDERLDASEAADGARRFGAPLARRTRRRAPGERVKGDPTEVPFYVSLADLYAGCVERVAFTRRVFAANNADFEARTKVFHIAVACGTAPGAEYVYEGEGDESADTTPGDDVFRLRVREEGGFSRLGAKGLAYEAPRMRAGDVAYCAAVRTVGGGVVACAGWAARARLLLWARYHGEAEAAALATQRERELAAGAALEEAPAEVVVPGMGMPDPKAPLAAPPGDLRVRAALAACELDAPARLACAARPAEALAVLAVLCDALDEAMADELGTGGAYVQARTLVHAEGAAGAPAALDDELADVERAHVVLVDARADAVVAAPGGSAFEAEHEAALRLAGGPLLDAVCHAYWVGGARAVGVGAAAPLLGADAARRGRATPLPFAVRTHDGGGGEGLGQLEAVAAGVDSDVGPSEVAVLAVARSGGLAVVSPDLAVDTRGSARALSGARLRARSRAARASVGAPGQHRDRATEAAQARAARAAAAHEKALATRRRARAKAAARAGASASARAPGEDGAQSGDDRAGARAAGLDMPAVRASGALRDFGAEPLGADEAERAYGEVVSAMRETRWRQAVFLEQQMGGRDGDGGLRSAPAALAQMLAPTLSRLGLPPSAAGAATLQALWRACEDGPRSEAPRRVGAAREAAEAAFAPEAVADGLLF